MAYPLAAVPIRSTTLRAIPAQFISSPSELFLGSRKALPNLGRRHGPRPAVGETIIGMGRLPIVQDRYRTRDSRDGRLGAAASGAAVGAAAGSIIPGIGTAVGSVIGSITGGLFHSSAAGPNSDAANAVAPEVQRGNYAAVKAVYKRANYIATQTSAAPWKALLATIPAALVQTALAYPGIPEEWVMGVSPQQVLPLVQKYAVYAPMNSFTAPAPYTPAVGPGTSAGSSIISAMAAGFFGTPTGAQVLQTGAPAIAKGAAQAGLASLTSNPLVMMAAIGLPLFLVAKMVEGRKGRRRA